MRGKLHYFGRIEGDEKRQAALNRWCEEKDDVLAGRVPRTRGESITVARLCEHCLYAKEHLVDSSELALRTFKRHHAACLLIASKPDRSTRVENLRPEDCRESERRSIRFGARAPPFLGQVRMLTTLPFGHLRRIAGSWPFPHRLSCSQAEPDAEQPFPLPGPARRILPAPLAIPPRGRQRAEGCQAGKLDLRLVTPITASR